MMENPNDDSPVIMMATDAVAPYPFLEKHKTAEKIIRFIKYLMLSSKKLTLTKTCDVKKFHSEPNNATL